MDGAGGDEHLLTTFTLDRSVLVEWTGIGTGGVLVAFFALGLLYAAVTGTGTAVGSDSLGVRSVAVGIVGTVLLVAGVIVRHELVHAAVIRYYGDDVSFGLGLAGFVLPYAYVTTDHRLPRDRFLVVAVAPLVLITTDGDGRFRGHRRAGDALAPFPTCVHRRRRDW